ncbi:hypothetical protein AcW1_006156 [Taiwanofungus camphoratus]|nr:hypothetical protein AcW2_004918 [Antrodia cinnamomea]KAI0934732.1 hypothetical protein AcV5_006477 [Antrodia cinnamomea]KAI0949974.1 hypothetical protein AcV7_008590 [Antrodia cinnamomea]KAI0957926.1 hypothetical protein AcW1_006156 [Antrodia cinnamomea]
MMQASHELQLMLVNTVRKDLESPETPRICLALDALIQFSTEDVIPAIQPRLVDLLSHSSAHIRRRALLAFHRLSQHNSEILGNIVNKTQKRLMDSDSMVVNAALTVGASLVNARYLAAEEFHATVSRLLHLSWKSYSENVAKWNLIKIMKSLRSVTPSMEELQTILTIAHKSSRHSPSTYAILYQCFVIASTVSSEILLRAQVESNIVLVQEIRHLLTSENVNDIYVFVSCLECIESKLWSGATADVPAVLEEWEVERVMRLLDSSDNFIRRKTLRILEGVDHGIVETYYSQLLRGDSASASLQGSEDASKRLLEVTEVICGEDGEMYAQHVKNMLHTVEGAGPLDKRPVLQEAVEEVLRRVQNGSTTFRSGCIGVSFAHVVEPDIQIGPTLMVIVSALVTEYLHMAPMSPDNLLHGLSTRLLSYAASIQDACLLSMMRVAAECDDVPASVIEVVRNLHDCSGRYIKRRCDQFINLCLRKGALKVIVSSAKSSSLPDLLSALEKYEAEKVNVVAPHSPPLKPVHSASRNSHSPNKLRYEAYEPPKLSSRLRRLSTSSSRASDDGSSKFVGQMRITQDAPSRTLSPGDLTLVAGRSDLVTLSSGSQRTRDVPLPAVHIEDDSVRDFNCFSASACPINDAPGYPRRPDCSRLTLRDSTDSTNFRCV